ncbi:hypothetical protein KIKIMORA_01880 [Brevundimonas phage vB_BpoS-Kikimora]|uniref:Uncharacterized protein n=1 Tax=Brevundimonas phage vB_BpoS-Kikimora TaxID=2948601 RepID=A0A9E7MSM2_9CAUD|nr:hypothetical protein KIKIMORA_01880 [Brevundimonas phage vB_BpoS-Kikimora]
MSDKCDRPYQFQGLYDGKWQVHSYCETKAEAMAWRDQFRREDPLGDRTSPTQVRVVDSKTRKVIGKAYIMGDPKRPALLRRQAKLLRTLADALDKAADQPTVAKRLRGEAQVDMKAYHAGINDILPATGRRRDYDY